MTSEVVVMNRLAVALAADSATTVSGPNSQKIWNSANKLFALSKSHPIGVMFFNNASILGIPWETIIKSYRSELGCRSFNTLREYGSDFLRYPNENRLMFSEDIQRTYLIKNLRILFKSYVDAAHDQFISNLIEGRPTTSAQELIGYVEAKLAEWERLDDLNTSPAHTEAALIETYGESIDLEIDSSLAHLEQVDAAKAALRRIAVLSVTKTDFESEYTGIVFAGFGKLQHFPAVYSVKVGGVILDEVRHTNPDEAEINDDYASAVIPFAQSDMVTTFLEGVNPRLHVDFIHNFVTLTLGLPQTIIEAITDLDEEQKRHWINQVQPHSAAAINTLIERLNEHRYRQHYAPIHASLVHLPKDELANVAEALVNLNSFQKKVSMEDETVGGPIDVAVISKGDGLVWIKRKHYFSRELNEHYFNNLRRDQEG